MTSFKTVSKIAVAVAAVLGTSSAFALDIAGTNAAPVQLVAAGSSAVRDAIIYIAAVELANSNGTVTIYRNQNTNFLAISGTARTYTGDPVNDPIGKVLSDHGISGQNFTIYYRAEGGSIWGPGSIVAKNLNAGFTGVKALDTTVAGFPAPTPVTFVGVSIPTSTVNTNYTLLTDTDTSGFLVDKPTQYGLADEEPGLLTDTNYPTAAITTKLPAASAPVFTALAGLPKTTLFGQTFGFIVNNNATSTVTQGLTSLTRQQLASIFATGGYVNWNKIPGVAVSAAIRKGRREPGSGTQAAAASYLMGVNTSRSNYTFAVAGGAVSQFASTGDLNTFVGTTDNAIGLAVVANPAPAGTKFIQINGVDATRENVANGTYDFAYELSSTIAPGTAGNSLQLAQSLDIIAQRAGSIPNVPSVFAIPSATNVPGSVVNGRPVAFGSRGGNSALPFQAK